MDSSPNFWSCLSLFLAILFPGVSSSSCIRSSVRLVAHIKLSSNVLILPSIIPNMFLIAELCPSNFRSR